MKRTRRSFLRLPLALAAVPLSAAISEHDPANIKICRRLPSEISDEDLLSVSDLLAQQIELRNQAEARLRDNEEGLRLIIESARDYAIYTLDERGYITRWNAGAPRARRGFSRPASLPWPRRLLRRPYRNGCGCGRV